MAQIRFGWAGSFSVVVRRDFCEKVPPDSPSADGEIQEGESSQGTSPSIGLSKAASRRAGGQNTLTENEPTPTGDRAYSLGVSRIKDLRKH